MARFLWTLASVSAMTLILGTAPAARAASCGNGVVNNTEECDDGNATNGDGCSDTCTIESGWACVGTNPSVCNLIVCGDGKVQGTEQCDGGGCCNSDCTFTSAATTCRGSAGVCDPAESCTGSTSACPDDAKSNAVCRASVGVCDTAESCDGTNNNCPADAKSNAICRPSSGVCDLGAETCDGTSNNCPADQAAPAGTLCRASLGVCDPAETCNGTSSQCPADARSTALCRPSAGVCDPAETCDGSAAACPGDAKSSAVCRASLGVCDPAESCDGTNNACPADTKSSAVCRPNSGVCDLGAETCDGTSNNCPADHAAPAGTPCRASVGVCDTAESCDGTSSQCPADAKSTALCRPSAGVCDVAESCDGTNNNCPADAKSNAVCRPAVNPNCDVAESCDGTSVDCPPDQLVNCSDNDNIACTSPTCLADGGCSIIDNCVEICRGAGFWQNHSGEEKDGANVGQDVLDAGGSIEVCGQTIDTTADLGNLDDLLEGLCIRVQGVKQRQLYRQLITTALNCQISEGGTCDQITGRFLTVKFSDCNALCAGDPVDGGPTLQECVNQLECFNGGGRIENGVCATGTCATDTETFCGNDSGDCPDIDGQPQACVSFDGNCASAQLCSQDLDAPAQICPKVRAASSPQTCHDARLDGCTIDSCQ
ncbi:MAG TPA: hypothetical protein VGK20_13255 [Candidatus Binatia bacterium]|jgi:cysteine-rich repeat protein